MTINTLPHSPLVSKQLFVLACALMSVVGLHEETIMDDFAKVALLHTSVIALRTTAATSEEVLSCVAEREKPYLPGGFTASAAELISGLVVSFVLSMICPKLKKGWKCLLAPSTSGA